MQDIMGVMRKRMKEGLKKENNLRSLEGADGILCKKGVERVRDSNGVLLKEEDNELSTDKMHVKCLAAPDRGRQRTRSIIHGTVYFETITRAAFHKTLDQ